MLPLPTEATIEAMNVSTDRRHPFHTYNDRNRFRQFGFTRQNIVVDMDDVERDMEISNGKGSLGHWCLGYSQCFSVISIFWYCSTIKTDLFLSYLSSLAFIQTNSSLAWDVVQKYVHGWARIMKPLCHWFIKSLTFRTVSTGHYFFFNDAVGWRHFYRHTMSNRTSLALQCG